MWAGVQKVSRPMVSCHEMSHMMPRVMHEVAKASRKPGQKGGVPGRAFVTREGEANVAGSEMTCMNDSSSPEQTSESVFAPLEAPAEPKATVRVNRLDARLRNRPWAALLPATS